MDQGTKGGGKQTLIVGLSIALGVVSLALVGVIGWTVNQSLRQDAEITKIESEVATKEKVVARLEGEVRQGEIVAGAAGVITELFVDMDDVVLDLDNLLLDYEAFVVDNCVLYGNTENQQTAMFNRYEVILENYDYILQDLEALASQLEGLEGIQAL